MQLDPQIIDKFKDFAKYLCAGFNEIKIPNNYFYWTNLNDDYRFSDTELIFQYGDAVIGFSDIAPDKIHSLQIDAPVKVREQIQSVTLDTWRNAGDTEPEETERWSKKRIITEQLDIISEIQASIREKVGAEYSGFKAELEAQITAKLGINHSTQTQEETVYEMNRKIVIPPWTSVSLTQTHSISDFKQTIRTNCRLGAKLRLNSGGWEKTFDSMHEFEFYMKGGGGGRGNTPDLDKFVNARKIQNLDMPDFEFTTERDRLYTDVQTSEVTRTDTPIERPTQV